MVEVPNSKDEAMASDVMRVFGDPMRSRIWGMLIDESPLTSAQIRQRLNQSDTGTAQRKQVPYSSVCKYLTDLTAMGLVEADQPTRRGTAYRVPDESVRMYDIAQQTHHQLVEVIRSRLDPQLAAFIKNYGKSGILALAREFAKRDPEEFQRMLQEDFLSTE